MVCYALLCVFSRFALILMLACGKGDLTKKHMNLSDHSMAVLLLWIFFVTYVSCLSCYLVVYLLQSCGHLLGKG